MNKGDRVTLLTNPPLMGTVVDVASDGEPKVKIDGSSDPGMYYPVSAFSVEIKEADFATA